MRVDPTLINRTISKQNSAWFCLMERSRDSKFLYYAWMFSFLMSLKVRTLDNVFPGTVSTMTIS